MSKVEKERDILFLAKHTMEKLYGQFEFDEAQNDSPDAAIVLKNNNIKIGIEITSVDKSEHQEYLNNNKIVKDINAKQLDNIKNFDENKAQPIKKIKISFPKEYIYDGAIKKLNKYSKYFESNNFSEIILLVHSSYLQTDSNFFSNCLKPWTEYLLSKQNFPYNKVIFVCTYTQESILIYDKNKPLLTPPNDNIEFSTTIMKSPIIPFDKPVNLNKMFNKEPEIKITDKKKRKSNK